jgi:alpha-beta hydrolase superfamily lysophospholipase
MACRRTATTFTLATPDGISLFVCRWLPEKPVKAVVQIAHGWAEHAGRYARVADCAERATRFTRSSAGVSGRGARAG